MSNLEYDECGLRRVRNKSLFHVILNFCFNFGACAFVLFEVQFARVIIYSVFISVVLFFSEKHDVLYLTLVFALLSYIILLYLPPTNKCKYILTTYAYKESKIAPQDSPARAYIAYHKLGGTSMDPQTETPTSDCECGVHPSIFYLLGTLLLTSCSTSMLCAAIMTDHWEYVTWDKTAVAAQANVSEFSLQWLLDDKVAKIEDTSKKKSLATFLVPMNGGIWTMCVNLNDDEITTLSKVGYPPRAICRSYLEDSDYNEARTDWQHRMQNLSISCALVCLIVLGSAALVGLFGVSQHQISAVLVTGVMYLLAGLFALFAILIIHFKRVQKISARLPLDTPEDGVVGLRHTALPFLSARVCATSWSLDLGWGGVAMSAMTSLFWVMLSKIMRYNPLTSMLM